MKIFKIIVKILINILFIILAVWAIAILYTGILMLVNGSFEWFPTEEDMAKARFGGFVLATFGAVAESISVIVLYKNNKRGKS